MGIVALKDLATATGGDDRLLGLDVGAKTIGLALSDVGRTIATPLKTIRRGKLVRDAETIAGIINGEGVGGLVIGLPLSMDGSQGPKCQSVGDFTLALLEILAATGVGNLPAAFWDERLSTAAVERMLIKEADMSRRRRAFVIDKAAAAYILQGALDAMAEGGEGR